MRKERFTSKIGPEFFDFHILCKMDREINSRDALIMKEKLKIAANQIYSEDKSRKTEAIFKVLLNSVYGKQLAGHGKYCLEMFFYFK